MATRKTSATTESVERAASHGLPLAPKQIVAIGASAGGLEALESLFARIPADTGLAFVVIQHLSPDFKSLMDELLARHTKMGIHVVEDGMHVQPNSIYLMPPKKEMRISGGRLYLSDRDSSHGLSLPIDAFFESLAADGGQRAVGVILSGSGSDGSRGVQAIHEAGGLVIVQRVDTAKFEGMPSAALATGVANLVLPPDQIPTQLIKHAAHPFPSSLRPEVFRPAITLEGEFADVFALLLERYGIDFTHYKSTTVTRRIRRRFELSDAADQGQYLSRLCSDSDELNSLYKDLLIGVTTFFRDPEAFDALAKALPQILDDKSPGDEIRVWVAGCATGEEAYSLAILMQEEMEKRSTPMQLKVFATDVHQQSLDSAATGVYSREQLAKLHRGRIERFFNHDGDQFRITQELRRAVIFATHNILRDAPFTKMDLVACRNLLIYFKQPAQSRALALLHYALNIGGLMFLGPSESVNDFHQEFTQIDAHWKIYRKCRGGHLVIGDHDASGPMGRIKQLVAPLVLPRAPSASPRLMLAYDALLADAIPPSVLVNELYEVVHVFGEARRFLHPPSGRQTSSILTMVGGQLRTALGAALHRAESDNETIVFDSIRIRALEGDGEQAVKLTVRPLPDARGDATYYLVGFEMQLPAPPAATDGVGGASGSGSQASLQDVSDVVLHRTATLETELHHTREQLQTTIEELQTSNEELQSTNEELVAANEELQSTNEELHSVNEELHTVNAEYQRKIDELVRLTADMETLLISTNVGVIYLDRSLCIRKFTPKVVEFFRLLPTDVGRPIGYFAGHMHCHDLHASAASVLETERPIEGEVVSRDGQPFLMRIVPYRTEKFNLDGVAMAFVDITQRKQAEQQVIETVERFHTLFEATPCGFVTVACDGTIVTVNLAALNMFGYERAELIGQPIEVLIPERFRAAHITFRDRYFQHPQTRSAGQTRGLDALRRDGSEFPVEIGLTPINAPEGLHVLVSIGDITERKRLEDQKDRLLEVAFAATGRNLNLADDCGPTPLLRGPARMATAPRSTSAFEEALQTFVRQVRVAVGAHQAAVNYIPDGDFSAAYHTHSFSTKYEKYNSYDTMPTGEGIWKLVIENKQPICMTQAQLVSHPRWRGFSGLRDERGLEHPPMRGWLAVPILSSESDDFVGIIQLSDKYEGDFTDDDVQLLVRLAQLMAPAFALQYANEQVNHRVEQRTAELARANAALEQSNLELQQFAYVASHDLQEPLRKIASYCQLLKEEQSQQLNEEGNEYLDVAIDGAKRLQSLVRDLLSFSRITSHGKPLAATDASTCLQEALGNLELAIQETGALVTANSLPRVMADSGQLTLVFQNLVGNAIKYCDEAVPRVHIGGRDLGGQYEFSVRDNGIGIAPQFQERIFQIFQRLHNRREYSGTGIGLTLCKRIIERFGGEIWVQSHPGTGSTFYFKLNKVAP